ncbi:transcriptional regulator with PAS, ATPase and Fis domain [Peribacillus deserti]|uniref:Transcriptional regulator with PAS, ATPase and Fis domain n=1 Tax=Peribacillus deserti TaxID=673318 RepID=A0ABS2QLD2_9BACI|nr:sigma 54-interacting transcriptional regulator [Peribacillus deserti]MBM7693980.1 transcriptional regulator with PAS, ATPase and Fis domain [Peribacillus deserti]
MNQQGIDILPVEWVKEVINIVAERLVVVDRKGIIRYMDSAYCDFLNITPMDAIGKHVDQVIENTRMHIVANTGIPELSSVQPIKGSEMIANRYPLYVNNELVGAAGTVIFRNPQEWLDYSSKIQPLLDELQYYKRKFEKEHKSKYRFSDLAGNNPRFVEAKQLAERGSHSQSSILLIGESGTGKELFAHSIHQNSTRAHYPFIRVNCASIPENLLESELFGYDEGAFTGAKRGGKKGKFELGHMGTVFLDEIGDMPLLMQSKLLRVLQEKEIERVGGQSPKAVDVRIIAATHRNLEEMVHEGKFRQDLYYRLNVLKVEIPPLRERREDILPIAYILLKKLEKKFNRQGIYLSNSAEITLEKHSWPGNIRELENVLERAINVLDGREICLEHLPLYLRDLEEAEAGYPPSLSDKLDQEKSIQPLKEIMAAVEKAALAKAIKLADGNKQKAAKMLGIGKTSFYDKCKLYNIN